MSDIPENKERTTPQGGKDCPSGGASNPVTTVTALTSVVVNSDEQIVNQTSGQSEPQNTTEDEKKAGHKKRPASEINGADQSEEPGKKVKTVDTQPVEDAGDQATSPNFPGRTTGHDSLEKAQDSKIGRRRRTNSRRVPENEGKHEPYAPAGTKFIWADNGHIDRTKSKVGQKDKSRYRLKLKATNGKEYTFVYTRRKIIDWNDKKDVASLNTWRNQIIKRKLDNETTRNRDEGFRPHWSEKEKAVLSSLVRDRIRKKGRQLNPNDWIQIAEEQNERFRGVKVHVGEKLPGSMNSRGKLTDSKALKKAHILGDRTCAAIKAQFRRWPDLAAMVQEELRKLGIVQIDHDNEGEASEGEDEEDEEDQGEDEDSGDELDLGLEDPSDDEDAGRRPASTQTGARLIPAGA